ncbi:MAG: tyrosine--tRNA ligase [Syntrophales bacterium]|jgi:tyrosyl-tRNA synthetase|nr:tyrosine--tRNA ligase [Syntrophales bacterium]MDY0044464.1 tyrosine--tRNA ligase [Syntrophales bacterium]
MSVYDTLSERGFIEQITDEASIKELLKNHIVTCYIGFDPTAASLHIGSLVPIMALVHLQRQGHRPIALVGGGTALIGDPSGKTEMRRILTRKEIDANAEAIKNQLATYMDFKDNGALLLNNADWITELNYVEFLRDIGRHFSVNRMLAAESYRMRLETGLNFIEFNYMLLQAYDFYYLNKHYGCVVQMGGNDQWGNIVAGIDLTRRLEEKRVFGITFPLLTTAQGHKMGKTEKGTVWLDSSLTSPYDYFQYWINTDDADIERFLALFTFLPMEEIRETGKLKDTELNMAKSVLAFEATKITHGEKSAIAAWKASSGAFHLRPVDAKLFPSSTIPRMPDSEDLSAITTIMKARTDFEKGIAAFELFEEVKLCASRGEARRLISQGGAYINGEKVQKYDDIVDISRLDDNGELRLRKGKKNYIIIKMNK